MIIYWNQPANLFSLLLFWLASKGYDQKLAEENYHPCEYNFYSLEKSQHLISLCKCTC